MNRCPKFIEFLEFIEFVETEIPKDTIETGRDSWRYGGEWRLGLR